MLAAAVPEYRVYIIICTSRERKKKKTTYVPYRHWLVSEFFIDYFSSVVFVNYYIYRAFRDIIRQNAILALLFECSIFDIFNSFMIQFFFCTDRRGESSTK